ncbi:MAG: dTDP-4-dehydrorhamnose reductase [Flavobacteriales bacterium]|nr:dTDP-4-dehydrorhamnose reductase [Flavobacteriales bacterium]
MADKIIVTGGNGQLGNCLRELEGMYPHYHFIFTDVAELDITDQKAVHALFSNEKPTWVINCAAYTAVDKAESDALLAEKLNATAVKILAHESKNVGSAFIQISTDYVFGGKNPNPLHEDEPTAPVSVYGRTKLMGEEFAKENPHHIIIRTAWLYSAYGNNFVKTMRRLGSEKKEINVVSDQWGTPTSAHDLAQAVMCAVQKPVWGVYHFTDEGKTTWAEFAQEVMKMSSLDCVVKPITTAQYPTSATRPEYSVLSKELFKKTYSYKIPLWRDSLKKVIDVLKTNK